MKPDCYVSSIAENPTPFEIQISMNERALLLSALSHGVSPYEDFERFRAEAVVACLANLNPQTIREILNFRSNPSASGHMALTGLPYDLLLPETPPLGRRATAKTSWISESILVGIGSLFGEIYSYVNEKNGEFIHNICPVKGSENVSSNESSENDFRLHIENCFFSYRPHFLMLFCLRRDRTGQAATTVANVKDAYERLSTRDRELLRQPLFKIRAPRSFAILNEDSAWSKPLPVIVGSERSPETRLNFNGTVGVNSEAEAALARFEWALNSDGILTQHRSQPGDLIIINNRTAMHGRTPFKAFYDGKDRWLQRAYLHKDTEAAFGSPEENIKFCY